MNPKVDDYVSRLKTWQNEIEYLRVILNDCTLAEDYKWRVPCYTYDGNNIALINSLKNYCAVAFFKGALLRDAKNILEFAGENSQAAKMIKFTSLDQIIELEDVIKAYIFEAIEIEKAGLKVELKKNSDDEIPEELLTVFEQDNELKAAFESLTPGRRRAYYIHFGGAKQVKTRFDRIAKYRSRILNGKGFNDCVCGLSKRMPGCDGSHKQLDKKMPVIK